MTTTPDNKQLFNLIMDMNRSLKILSDKVDTHGLDFQMAHKCIDDAGSKIEYYNDSINYEVQQLRDEVKEQKAMIDRLQNIVKDQCEDKVNMMKEVQKYKEAVDVLRTTVVKHTEVNEELTEALYQDSIVRENVKAKEQFAGSISKDICNKLFKADEMALILDKEPVLKIMEENDEDEMSDDIVLNYYCNEDIIETAWIKKDTHPVLRYKFKKEMSKEEFNNMALHRLINHMMHWWNRHNTYKIKFDDGHGETEIIEELQDVLDMDYDKTYEFIQREAWNCYKNKTN